MAEELRNSQEWNVRLNSLLAEYRAVLPDPESNVNFMPQLWEKIDRSRTATLSWRHWAQGFVTAAAAICVLMAIYLVVPETPSPVYSATYLEALTADHAGEQPVAYV